MENRPGRAENRLRIGLLVFALVASAIIITLYLNPGLRLSLGHQLRIVPGADAEVLAGPGEADLIIVSEPVGTDLTHDRHRQVARYLVRHGETLEVTDLASESSFPLPMAAYDEIRVSPERDRLLFISGDQAARIEIGSSSVELLDGLPPGEWSDDVYIRGDVCSGSSADDRYTLCIRTGGRAGSIFIFGNWEVQARQFGVVDDWNRLLRGRGSIPIVGFGPESDSLYIQNEHGIWRVGVEQTRPPA